MALLNFDAKSVSPQDTFDPIPAGWYNMRITGSEMKPTKDGQGSYLNLKLQVIDGPHANRVLFDRLNTNNKSEVAREIAYKTLSSICHATGVIQLADSNQLHGIPMQVRVKLREAKDGYDASNEIGGYKALDGVAGTTTPSFVPPPAPSPAAAPAGNTPPWVK